MRETKVCPLCGVNAKQKVVFEVQNLFVSVGSVATCGYDTQKQDYGRGDCEMSLCECEECGYIYNQSFEMSKMQESYKEDLYFTPKVIQGTMGKFIMDLKARILHHAKSKSVFLEIAPGGCDLLLALAKDSLVYSIDPSQSSALYSQEQNIIHIQEFFDRKKIEKALQHKIDFVIFRHLIEHIDKPREFIEEVVSLLQEGAMIYVETPNGEEILRHKRFYELRYEHVAYWTPETLENAFLENGCEVVERVFYYNQQWFGLFLRKAKSKATKQAPKLLPKDINQSLWDSIISLNQALRKFRTIALYGASSHATSLVNYLEKENILKIQYAIDLDTRRQEKFIQKTNICIKRPSRELLSSVDCVLMAMPIYEDKVLENEIKPLISSSSAGGGGGLSSLLAVA